MMSDFKPIETIYNGYRFRSRLEARCAVLFDALRLKYEYEPEGYQLSDGTWYLPDFYISSPTFSCYVEVKANRPGAVDELYKPIEFVNESTNVVLIISEIPNGEEGLYWFPVLWYDTLSCSVNAYWCGISWDISCAYLIRDFSTSHDTHPLVNLQIKSMLKEKGEMLLKYEPNSQMDWSFFVEEEHNDFPINIPTSYKKDNLPFWIDNYGKRELQKAYQAARKARFEHGETPTKGGYKS